MAMKPKTLKDVFEELSGARQAYPPMRSAHEGYAVIAEELDELWDLVRSRQCGHDFTAMRKEAVQVAAMALRFIEDVCDTNGGGRGRK